MPDPEALALAIAAISALIKVADDATVSSAFECNLCARSGQLTPEGYGTVEAVHADDCPTGMGLRAVEALRRT